MKIEWLIGFYMLVCLSMTAFNFGFLANERIQTRRLEKKRRKLAAQLDELVKSGQTSQEHLRSLRRSLKTLSGLESFDLSLESFREENPSRCERYLREITPVLEELADWHADKSALRCAFFSYVVGKWYRKRPASPRMVDTLLSAVRTRPFYARQNAFTAIAAVGSARDLATAVEAIQQAETFHHPKLITEALLAYPGDREELAEALTAHFSAFRPDIQAAIINFGRMADIVYLDERDQAGRRERLRSLMADTSTDTEVRLACIRFFTRDPWVGVADALWSFARHDEEGTWELAAVAASALSKYPGDETVSVLIECLSSRIWHVRHNAARSLRELGITFEQLDGVVSGNDRFARDTVLFYWREES